ncbi:MAG TPA: carboxypeptidase-like regulatory domain-containing protein, partial [Opitutaceae bacterium]
EREVPVALRAPARSRVTTEHTVAVQIEGRAGGFARTDPVIIRTLFVPEKQKPGPLFAVLAGSLDFGVHRERGDGAFASQIRLSGEVSPGVTFEAHALDGDSSLLGSQLELAGRDTWHVSLKSPGWHATVGEARAPSLGFLAPGVYGRGAAAGVSNTAWSADAFALRDSFVGSVREAAGVKVSGPGESWEVGAILQRSRDITFAEEERAGAYTGLHWAWRGVKGRSEVAFAGSKDSGEGIGLAQSLTHNGERLLVDARFEHAEEGFFLQDQSSERQSLLAEWKAGAGWTLLANADRSEQTGRLRTLLQERDNTGGPDDPPEIIELINQVATRQESHSAGARREFAAGTLRAVFKRQERAGELDTLREFVEDAFEIEWTSRPDDPWWRLGATVGREEGDGGSAKFAEVNGSAYWSPTAWSRLEGNVRWTSALSGEPQGFRREGIHGQIAGSITPAKGWKAELRMEGYDYADFEPRTRLGALVRFPIGRNGWSGAVEWGRDTHSGDDSAWLVVRAPLSIQMPWRPTRGTVAGRVTDMATGAGISSVLVSSGRYRAMSDPAGRYQLPAMEPGAHEIEIQTPGGWTRQTGVPTRVEVVAGKADSLEIGLVELGTLRGEVAIIDSTGTARAAPAGVLVAEGEGGATHETLVFRGAFTMRLPPGTYRLSFVSELPDEVGRQFSAEVTVGNTEPATVRLEAREQTRRMRRTLSPGGGGPGGGK